MACWVGTALLSQKLPNSLMNLLCLEAWERNKEPADGRPPLPTKEGSCLHLYRIPVHMPSDHFLLDRQETQGMKMGPYPDPGSMF